MLLSFACIDVENMSNTKGQVRVSLLL